MNLSKENLEIATEFFLGNKSLLEAKDKDYQNLMLTYAYDNNSSTLREGVTLYYLGYKSFYNKLGPDGFNDVTQKQIEVKPKYVAEGKKLGNSGNFNDMTMELWNKKMDYSVVCSCFAKDRLIYIVEFPYKLIAEKLKQPILRAKAGGRVVCHFGYKDYDDPSIIVHYYNDEIAKLYNCLSKGHSFMLNIRNAK